MKDPGSYANPINSSFQKFRTTRLCQRGLRHDCGATLAETKNEGRPIGRPML